MIFQTNHVHSVEHERKFWVMYMVALYCAITMNGIGAFKLQKGRESMVKYHKSGPSDSCSWGWINNGRIFIFLVNYPFMCDLKLKINTTWKTSSWKIQKQIQKALSWNKMGNYAQLGVDHHTKNWERYFSIDVWELFDSITGTGMRTSRNSHVFKLISGCVWENSVFISISVTPVVTHTERMASKTLTLCCL